MIWLNCQRDTEQLVDWEDLYHVLLDLREPGKHVLRQIEFALLV